MNYTSPHLLLGSFAVVVAIFILRLEVVLEPGQKIRSTQNWVEATYSAAESWY